MFSKSIVAITATLILSASALGQQQVTLPLPRLLTLMPMGGQAGTSFEVSISGQFVDDVTELSFSSPKITAKPVAGTSDKFTVIIADDTPVGVYDARVMTRLGVSSARAFSVSTLSEVVRSKPNNSIETALSLAIDSICNAMIENQEVMRPVRLASMEWPIADAKKMGEIPAPRLVADIPVSVTDSEMAPLSITLVEDKVFEVEAGEKLTIPLHLNWRDEFNGTSIKVKAYGEGFSGMKDFEIPIKAEQHAAIIDLAALKIAPGDYTFAFHSLGICKYRYNPAAVPAAEEEQKKAEAALATVVAEAKGIDATDAESAKKVAEKQKQAEAEMKAVTNKMKSVADAANPKDTVEILVSQPIRLHVKPVSTKTAGQ